MPLADQYTLRIWRDSVHAGDDGDAPHEIRLQITPDETLASVLQRVLEARYLASISGGQATWIVQARAPVAVVAQQWPAPRLLVDPATPVATLVDASAPCQLEFRYWCQVDPETVVTAIQGGQPLPERYQLVRRPDPVARTAHSGTAPLPRLASGLGVVFIGCEAFAWWGLHTVPGRHVFDEMAGMVPMGAGLFGLLCGFGALLAWRRGHGAHRR